MKNPGTHARPLNAPRTTPRASVYRVRHPASISFVPTGCGHLLYGRATRGNCCGEAITQETGTDRLLLTGWYVDLAIVAFADDLVAIPVLDVDAVFPGREVFRKHNEADKTG